MYIVSHDPQGAGLVLLIWNCDKELGVVELILLGSVVSLSSYPHAAHCHWVKLESNVSSVVKKKNETPDLYLIVIDWQNQLSFHFPLTVNKALKCE